MAFVVLQWQCICADRGIEIRANTLDLDENKIKKLRAQGYGVAKIAQVMGCSATAVRND